jgi:Zn-dependent metalloprotease
VLHEYGHAIHDGSGFQFASEEAGAISEGFGDYWGVDMGDIQARKLGVPELEPLACVMDWDATAYTSTVPHCLRRLDEPLKYPDDLDGEVHDDGRIWSHALWDINRSIGHVKADTVILEGQIDFPGTTMPDLATRIVATAQSIYGNSTASKVRAAFEARGIL